MRDVIDVAGAVAVGPYSQAVRSGGQVFCSGQTPLDPSTKRLVAGGIGAQTAQCFANLFVVLAAAGLTADDVIKVNVYLTDMGTFEAMNTAYEAVFQPPYPARTTVAVAALPLGADVEVELVAGVRSDPAGVVR